MPKLFTSASKIVFILLSVAACIGFFIGKLEAKDFMLLASMAFSFYFANKGSSGDVTQQTTTTPDGATSATTVSSAPEPYLGK